MVWIAVRTGLPHPPQQIRSGSPQDHPEPRGGSPPLPCESPCGFVVRGSFTSVGSLVLVERTAAMEPSRSRRASFSECDTSANRDAIVAVTNPSTRDQVQIR